jgi:hypothetical protein
MTRLTWSLLLCVALGLQILKAQNGTGTNNAPQDSPKLTGSLLKAEDIIGKSDAIFKGRITRLFGHSFAATSLTGRTNYIVKVQALDIYKGTIDSLINIDLLIEFGPQAGEKWPELNHTYIFFVTMKTQDNHNSIDALKLIDATDANIAKVKALIAAAPASK